MIEPITFFVEGVAKPAGSKRGFFIAKLKRVVIVDANPNSKDWKTDVKYEASRAYSGAPLECPISVTFTFHIVRPNGHYRSGKNSHLLRDTAPKYPAKKPDLLKLARGVEDAMTGIIYRDDAQIVSERLFKRFAATPGVTIKITEEVEP